MSSSGYWGVAGSCVEVLPVLWPALQSPSENQKIDVPNV